MKNALVVTAALLSISIFPIAACDSAPFKNEYSSVEPAALDEAPSALDAAAVVDAPPASGDGGVAPKKEKSDGGFTLPLCCSGKGSCVPETAIPEDAKGKLKADTCDEGSLCAPTEATKPDYKPTACEASGIGTKGAGVCLSTCLDLGSMGALAKQGTCDADHNCVPCKAFGQPTNAPGCPTE